MSDSKVFLVQGRAIVLIPKTAAELIKFLLECEDPAGIEVQIFLKDRTHIACSGADVLNTWAQKKNDAGPDDPQ
jgi:hypothetical protein